MNTNLIHVILQQFANWCSLNILKAGGGCKNCIAAINWIEILESETGNTRFERTGIENRTEKQRNRFQNKELNNSDVRVVDNVAVVTAGGWLNTSHQPSCSCWTCNAACAHQVQWAACTAYSVGLAGLPGRRTSCCGLEDHAELGHTLQRHSRLSWRRSNEDPATDDKTSSVSLATFCIWA